eukprot:scaffold3665_cov214-Amphora_coffeaeformis.AAC.2
MNLVWPPRPLQLPTGTTQRPCVTRLVWPFKPTAARIRSQKIYRTQWPNISSNRPKTTAAHASSGGNPSKPRRGRRPSKSGSDKRPCTGRLINKS